MINPKNIQIKLSQKDFSEPVNRVDLCEASKASVEIMLERFCNSKEIDFPFSQ